MTDLILQFRFPGLRNAPQHITDNIHATFNVVPAIDRNVSGQALDAFGEVHAVNATSVRALVAKDTDGFHIIVENTP